MHKLVAAVICLAPVPAFAATDLPATSLHYGIWTLLPPVVAIILAMLTRNALLALLVGVLSGATILASGNLLVGAQKTIDTHLVASIADSDHAAIILFSIILGGMVGVLAASGATSGLVNWVGHFVKSRKSGMIATYCAGLVVFFDDYANCLLVGNTMRPITDNKKISREKLAYIVDSTAAPIATVALASTWVGFQVGLLDENLPGGSGYAWFIKMLPYAFYSIFTLVFVGLIVSSQRDFGPMAKAEARAFHEGLLTAPQAKLMTDELEEPDVEPWNQGPLVCIATIGTLILTLAGSILWTGWLGLPQEVKDGQTGDQSLLLHIIGNSNSYEALLWSSTAASLVALTMSTMYKRQSLNEAIDGWLRGAKAMFVACAILVLAWALGSLCKQDALNLPDFITSGIDPSPWLLPTISFVLAGVIAFATGTSYGTMGILIPLMAAIAWDSSSVLESANVESIQLATMAAILSGAVFGDHCSPISDTTIMSSMGANSDHLDHVKTQLPYAISCGIVAIVFGYLPAGFGFSPWLCMPIGMLVLAAMLFILGRKPTEQPPTYSTR